jgi:purine-nucleoside phosphorylase
MPDLPQQIEEAVRAIRDRSDRRPAVGVILGTGLGSLVDQIATEATIEYEAIPHFPRSTAVGHTGRLVCRRLQGLGWWPWRGGSMPTRGYSFRQITFPVRLMKALGAEILIVSNACGGMNPHYELGDIVVIDDHINLMHGNPLIGINDDSLGPRFPDMSCPYDPELIRRALAVARREDFVAHKGIYVAVTGPNLETRAEYRFLRRNRAPTWWACPPCPRSSSPSTPVCGCWGSRSSPTCASPTRWSRRTWPPSSPPRGRRSRGSPSWSKRPSARWGDAVTGDAVLLVFVRAPERGQVKTRLAADIGADAALAVYERLGLHTVDAARALGGLVRVRICHTPDGAGDAVAEWLGEGVEYRGQGDGDLGQRMARAFADAFAEGAERVLIVGSDLPDLTTDLLRDAIAGLDEQPAVLGPARRRRLPSSWDCADRCRSSSATCPGAPTGCWR